MPDLVRCAAGWRKASRKWMVQKGCGTSWKAEVATGTRRSAVTNGRPQSRNQEVPADLAGFELQEGDRMTVLLSAIRS